MAQVSFAKAIRRHAECPPATVAGATLRSVLDGYFAEHPGVRSYVLDEHGSVRKHIAVFINDTLVVDRSGLADVVTDDDRVAVFQALSGGST